MCEGDVEVQHVAMISGRWSIDQSSSGRCKYSSILRVGVHVILRGGVGGRVTVRGRVRNRVRAAVRVVVRVRVFLCREL